MPLCSGGSSTLNPSTGSCSTLIHYVYMLCTLALFEVLNPSMLNRIEAGAYNCRRCIYFSPRDTHCPLACIRHEADFASRWRRKESFSTERSICVSPFLGSTLLLRTGSHCRRRTTLRFTVAPPVYSCVPGALWSASFGRYCDIVAAIVMTFCTQRLFLYLWSERRALLTKRVIHAPNTA